jgi:hypothetical protein
MKRRGKVYHLRPRDGNILSQIVKNKVPPVDYILMFEGELNHSPEVAKLKIPKVWWFYDSIVLFEQQIKWANETAADIAFIREKRHVPLFKERLSCKTFWLTMGYDETLWHPIDMERTKDVGFVGWISDVRGRLLNILAEGGRSVIAHSEAPNTWGETKFKYSNGPRLGYDLASAFYSGCKLGFHHVFRGDATWRPLEVSGCETACLTDKMDGMDDMFDIKRELIVYNNEDEMVELADYYINHDEEREAIAEAAYKRVLKDHTWSNRLDVIEGEVRKLK